MSDNDPDQEAALPMPFPGRRRGRLSQREWDESRVRREEHHRRNPDYQRAWRLPRPGTTRAIWDLVAKPIGLNVDAFLARHRWITPEVRADELWPMGMAAFAIGLDTVIEHETLDLITILDALASRFSDHFRSESERTGATSIRQMDRGSVDGMFYDFRLLGLDVEELHHRLTLGVPDLYMVTGKRGYRVHLLDGFTRDGAPEGPVIEGTDSDYVWDAGAQVARLRSSLPATTNGLMPRRGFEGGQTLAKYNLIVSADQAWRDRRRGRITLEHEARETPRPKADIAGGWAFNVVPESSERVRSLEEYQDNVVRRLVVHEHGEYTEALARLVDSGRATKKQKGQLRSLRADQRVLAAAAGRVDKFGHIKIRSAGTHQTIVGRHQSADFGPMESPNKVKSKDVVVGNGDWTLERKSSLRDRLFMADGEGDELEGLPVDFVGFDMASSMYQLEAVFLGLRDLEERLRTRSMAELCTELARQKHAEGPAAPQPFVLLRPERFEGAAGEAALVDAFKAMLTPLGYGSQFKKVAGALRSSHSPLSKPLTLAEKKNLETGIFDQDMTFRNFLKANESVGRAGSDPDGLGGETNLRNLVLDARLGLASILSDDPNTLSWVNASKKLAEIAHARDPYGGFHFTDVFDQTHRRLNPVEIWGPDTVVNVPAAKGSQTLVGVSGATAWREIEKNKREIELVKKWAALHPDDAANVAKKVARRQKRIETLRWRAREWEKMRPHVRSGHLKVYLNLPVNDEDRAPADSQTHAKGDRRVSLQMLRRAIAPDLIHNLEVGLTLNIVEQLKDAFGGPPFHQINDAYYVRHEDLFKLRRAFTRATPPWFQSLGVRYREIIELFEDPEHGDARYAEWFRQIHGTWQHRVATANWPRVHMKRIGPTITNAKGGEYPPFRLEVFAAEYANKT